MSQDARGCLRFGFPAVLLGLICPIFIYRASAGVLDTIWAWYIGINLTTIAVYGLDKVISNINEPMLEERTYLRAPEWVLYLLLPLLGGGIGAGLGIRFF